MSTPDMFVTNFYVPRESQSQPPFNPGDHPRPAGRSGPGSYEVTVFALGPVVHKTLCVSSKSGVSVSPIPVELLWSRPTGLQRQMPLGLFIQTPQTWEPGVGLRTLSPMGELLWYNYSPVCELPTPGGYGVWLYHECAPPTILLWFLFCLWT